MSLFTCTQTLTIHQQACTHTHARMHARAHTCTHTRAHAQTRAHAHTCTHTHTHFDENCGCFINDHN